MLLKEGQRTTYDTKYGKEEALCFRFREKEYWVKRFLNDNRYEIRGLLGIGGLGCVFGAYDHWNYEKKVVIKTPYYMGDYCYPYISRGQKVFEQQVKGLNKIYEREKKHLSSFSNLGFDSIVNLNDYFLDRNLDLCKKFRDAAGVNYYIREELREQAPFIVMKYIRGESLKKTIEKAPLAPAKALRIAKQVLDLMQALHLTRKSKRGREFYYLLCDLKADNIIITDQSQISLIDFGAVKVHWCDQGEIDTPIFVTDGYAAPEVYSGSLEFRDNTRIDYAFDIFTVGALLAHCLTGRHPQNFLINSSPPQHNFDLPAQGIAPSIQELILRATRKEKTQRYPTAAAMIQEINQLLKSFE